MPEMSPETINEACARKLGWELIHDDKAGYREWKRGSELRLDLPDYCRKIEAAWKIVEKIGEGFSVGKSEFGLSYYCLMFNNPNVEEAIEVEADTAPMAICLAFLKLP